MELVSAKFIPNLNRDEEEKETENDKVTVSPEESEIMNDARTDGILLESAPEPGHDQIDGPEAIKEEEVPSIPKQIKRIRSYIQAAVSIIITLVLVVIILRQLFIGGSNQDQINTSVTRLVNLLMVMQAGGGGEGVMALPDINLGGDRKDVTKIYDLINFKGIKADESEAEHRLRNIQIAQWLKKNNLTQLLDKFSTSTATSPVTPTV